MTNYKPLRCILALAVPLLLMAAPSSAQQTAPPLVQVFTLHINPGTEGQFEEWMKALGDQARKDKAPTGWLVSQSMTGEPTFVVAVEHGTWANLGAGIARGGAAGSGPDAARLAGLFRSSVRSFESAFYRVRPDLGSMPAPGEMFVAANFSYVAINPGMMQQYVEVTRQTREASMAVMPDSRYVVLTPGMGATSVLVVGLVRSWSDMDAPAMNPGERVLKHFGEQKGRPIVNSANQAINFAETRVGLNRTRPDLNYQPQN